VDIGITHFDTSPYYGFGLAEAELGRFGCRRLTIATKIGLYPPVGTLGHRVSSLWVRKAVGKFIPTLSRPIVDWTVARAERSLGESLQRLNRDHIDILFLHEPRYSLSGSDELQLWLERERDRGRIAYWGLAGEPHVVREWMQLRPSGIDVVQTRNSLMCNEAVALSDRAPDITYGYLSSPAPANMDGAAILREALRRNPRGAILFSTSNEARILKLRRIAL
jgi:aryl-alcohol dehydrogenase-like predicted oxidoreductase